MKTFAIIGCCGRKVLQSGPVRDMYGSELFRSCVRWAEANCDGWLVLSANHGVVLDPDDHIDRCSAGVRICVREMPEREVDR